MPGDETRSAVNKRLGDLRTETASAKITRGKSLKDHPQQVGPYKILEILGEGGMGVVYLAQQEKPIRRRVALKLIKLGMDTKQVIARLETERQALALMNHPNVAKVLDAGSTEQGRPYFVMEYVPGVTITDYCDRHRQSTTERLKLFMQVCDAIQHAHQKGVIHRDIKPSNVLVTIEGDKLVPKVIDFGVAKATEHHLAERTLFTEQGQLIGTPEYMSPEQAEMTALDIDTRTDIYSLGVLLYELLTGALPFEAKSLRRQALVEIQRIIREEEPPKPSTRLSSMGDESTIAAERRHTDRTSLTRQLRGDLDWITMKALEKDRMRRYATASELADDVARHLNHEPVLASPPSAAYRLTKFVRRNKGSVAAALAIIVILVAGLVASLSLYVRAEQARADEAAARGAEAEQRRLADEAKEQAESERDRAQQAEREAATEAETAKQVSEFLVGLFEVSDPSEALGNTITAREILDKGAERITDELKDQPEIQATLMNSMGNVYRSLGLYEAATPLLESSLETRRKLFGEEHPHTLDSINNLASLYRSQGRYNEAEPLFVQTLELGRRVFGEEHSDTLDSMNNLALLYESRGRYDQAEPLLVRLLELRRRADGEEHPDTLNSMNNLALLYKRQGRYDEAEPLLGRALELHRRVLGEEHPKTLTSMNNLAVLYKKQSRYDRAEPLLVQTLELRRRILGEEHPSTLTCMNNLAAVYDDQARYDKAEPLYVQTLELRRHVLGEEHPDTLTSMNNLASLYRNQGRYDEAFPLYENTLELSLRMLGEEHPHTLATMNNLALLYKRQGLYDQAEPLYVRALELNRRVMGEEHPRTLSTVNNLAVLYKKQGRYDKAEPLYVRTLELRRRVLGEEHPKTLTSMNNLASLYRDQGRYYEAEPLFVQTLELHRRVFGEEHPRTLSTMNNLGLLYERQGRYYQAEPLYVRALELNRRVMGEEYPDTLRSMNNLAVLYKKQGRYDEAEPLLRECLSIFNEKLPNHWGRLATMSELGGVLTSLGRFDQAETLLLEGYEKMEDNPRVRDKRKTEVLEHIVKLYEAWGKPEKAAEWRAKLPQKEDSQP